MKFNAVFFDLDGTLVNSLIDLAVSVNHVLTKHGFPTHDVEKFKYFAGDGIAKMLERAAPPEIINDTLLEELKFEFLDFYSEHYADNTVAYEGMKELVYLLKQKGIKLAVVTNKAQDIAEIVVKKVYGDVFDYILGLRPDVPAKPDPTGIFMAMDELKVTPEECAFVGDTGMDVAAGVNAKAYPIGVLWGFREKDELQRFGAKAFAENSDELSSILLGEV